jgi:hypothetical protein
VRFVGQPRGSPVLVLSHLVQTAILSADSAGKPEVGAIGRVVVTFGLAHPKVNPIRSRRTCSPRHGLRPW